MAVVGWRRMLEGTELSGKVGESLRIVERWAVRTDSPMTSKLAILGAVPVGWYSSHWEFGDCKAMEFSLSPNGRDGMIWTLTATFYIPPKDKKLGANGRPADYWECSGGTSTVPAFKDAFGEIITNSAKDPLEGLEREREEESWTLVKYYDNDSWKADRDLYAGTVNSDAWAGGGAREWKCYFKGAKKVEFQDCDLGAAANGAAEGVGENPGDLQKRVFVETAWEFRKEPDTWRCKPWNVGFMELVSGGKKTILGADKKPVKQPVALNQDGTAKSPGDPPEIINGGDGVDLYDVTTFAIKFGEPYIIPT